MERTREEKIAYLLKAIGIMPNCMGWRYLNYAIELVLDDWGVLDAITKQLYPTIARKFGSTSSRVERAMRHVIEVAFSMGPTSDIYEIFGGTIHPDVGKPNNSLFIATVAEVIAYEPRHPLLVAGGF